MIRAERGYGGYFGQTPPVRAILTLNRRPTQSLRTSRDSTDGLFRRHDHVHHLIVWLNWNGCDELGCETDTHNECIATLGSQVGEKAVIEPPAAAEAMARTIKRHAGKKHDVDLRKWQWGGIRDGHSQRVAGALRIGHQISRPAADVHGSHGARKPIHAKCRKCAAASLEGGGELGQIWFAKLGSMCVQKDRCAIWNQGARPSNDLLRVIRRDFRRSNIRVEQAEGGLDRGDRKSVV